MKTAKPKLVTMKKKASAPKPQDKRGAAKMREAADEIVGRDCKPIIEALSSNCKNGETLSAKFLYSLAHSAEESTEGEGGASKLRSIATEWANSPEWIGDSEAEETGEEDDAD
jgi:hypothetical protein